MPELWVPGAVGPLDQFIERLHRRIESYRERKGLDEVAVEFELADGAVFTVRSVSADPGFGFITICPHSDNEEDDEDVILPMSAIRRITLGRPEPARARFGFSATT
jgi:cold shock CspA family protein